MKKNICFLMVLMFVLIPFFAGCSLVSEKHTPATNIESDYVIFTAKNLPSTPSKVEETVRIERYVLTYYNVYRDENDNFILADETSYIKNSKVSHGLKLGGKEKVAVYDKMDYDFLNPIEHFCDYPNGEWAYHVFLGFVIKINPECDPAPTDVNIGHITHWSYQAVE